MKTTHRLTAIGLLLAALGSTASAAVLTFDTGLVKPDANGIDQATNIDGTNLSGFIFSGGVWAYNKNTKVSGNEASDDNPAGFLANRDSNAANLGIITISLDQSIFKGRYFQSVLLQYYTGGLLWVTGYSGNTQVFEDDPFTAGQSAWFPAFPSTDYARVPLNADLKIDRLEFRAESTSGPGNTFLALDNLDFTLTAATVPPGGTVPEPASYALVGLALLAAGTARRRRA